MKRILLIFFLFVSVVHTLAFPVKERNVVEWAKNIRQEKSVDTTEFYAFAKTCIQQGKSTELINTYKEITDAGKKDIQPGDLHFLNILYCHVDTLNATASDFYTCYYISRVFIIYHLDSTLPAKYAATALSIGQKLHDDKLILKSYKLLASYDGNIKHDLLSDYKWLLDMDLLIQKSDVGAIKEENIEVYAGYAIVYYYLEDNAKCIEYISQAIATARNFHKYEREVELFLSRSFYQLEIKDIDPALRSLDTADIIARKLPNKVSLQNEIIAQRFNIYEIAGRDVKAIELSKKVNINDLKGRNDYYYDYLYHRVKLYMKDGNYKVAQNYIDIYMSGLKGWNLQRLKNAYELKYTLYKKVNVNDSAIKYFELYNIYNDSLHHSKNGAAVIKEQIKYQILQKDEALKLEMAENKIKVQTIKFIIAGSVTIVLLLLLTLAYRNNKSLHEKERLNRLFSQQLIENTEQEQNRLANELHDGLGQELLLLKNSLLQHQMRRDADSVAGIIESVRGMARELYPAMLNVVGLKAAIENQLHKIDETEKIFVASELEYEGLIDKESQLQLYRIFQEAITNVLKYAQATSVYVGLKEDEQGRIKLEIKDNGCGFNVTKKITSGEGFGLVSMQKRADAVNGILKINSSVIGTEITIIIKKNDNNNS